MPGASLHVVGDLKPAGLFTVSRMPSALSSASVTIAGVPLAPSSGSLTFRVPPSAAPGAAIVVSDGTLSRAFAVADPGATTWVVLLAGQSNMIGRTAADASSWPAAASFQTQQLCPLAPSASIVSAQNDAGPFLGAKRFATDFLSAHPGDSLVFVTGAVGGTAFSDSHWNPGDDLYTNLVALARGIQFGHPTWRLRGMIYQGFERDAQNAMSATSFRAALDAFVSSIRSDLNAAQLPIVFGEMPAGFVGSTAAKIAVRDEVLLAPSRLPYTAVASSRSPAVAPDDGLHFTQAGALLIGDRFAPALAAAEANVLA